MTTMTYNTSRFSDPLILTHRGGRVLCSLIGQKSTPTLKLEISESMQFYVEDFMHVLMQINVFMDT